MELVQWGLVPSWAKDPKIGNRLINARAESVADKPAFRAAFRRRRCLVPADGYYEWQKRPGGKLPFLIHLPHDRPFAFAGLWEAWRPPGSDESLYTCTVITTDANERTRPIHDRMPVILNPEHYNLWLDPKLQDASKLQPLLRPLESSELHADPVSTRVNSPRNDDPGCVEIQPLDRS